MDIHYDDNTAPNTPHSLLKKKISIDCADFILEKGQESMSSLHQTNMHVYTRQI